MLPSCAVYFDSDTGNVDYYFREFRISCDSIGLKTSMYDITFLKKQGHRQEWIKLRSGDAG